MRLAETYRAFSQAFSYPWNKDEMLLSLTRIAAHIEETGKFASLAGLIEFVAGNDLTRIQEEYTTTFDLSPACAPYVGHHLHGDTHKKGAYMIRLKGIFREHGYQPPEDELPDHLSVVFEFAAHLARTGADATRRKFLSDDVMTGVNKMRESVDNKPDLHWKHLITAACILCAADCEEVTSC